MSDYDRQTAAPKPKAQAPSTKKQPVASNPRHVSNKHPSTSAAHKPQISNKFAVSDRGRYPISRTVQATEDVELHVQFPEGADQGTLEASIAGFYDVRSVRRLGLRNYEVVLRPRAALVEATKRVGRVPVNAQLELQSTSGGVVIEPLAIQLDVEAPGVDQDDFGSRPSDTADAIARVLSAWEAIYAARMVGVDTFNGQVRERDPEPKPSNLEVLLGIAATLALGSATAGIGAGFVEGISASAALTEMGKVLLENTLSTGVTEAVKAGMTQASAEPVNRRTPNGTLLSLPSYFFATQKAALVLAGKKHVDKVRTSLKSLTARLDAQRSGDGYRAAVDVAALIEKQHVAPSDVQYEQSVQAWLNLKATVALGTVTPTQRNGKPDQDPGVDLSKMLDVNAATIYPDHEYNTQMAKAPGVLYLELKRLGSLPAFEISHAKIDVENDVLLEPLRKPLGHLRIPVVVSYNETPNFGTRSPGRTFVITRNEKGVIAADDSKGLLRTLFNESDAETARRILAYLDQQQVRPVRG